MQYGWFQMKQEETFHGSEEIYEEQEQEQKRSPDYTSPTPRKPANKENQKNRQNDGHDIRSLK